MAVYTDEKLYEHGHEAVDQETNTNDSYQNSGQESELIAARAEIDRLKERLARERADFENFSKRSEKERASWMKASQTQVLTELLAIVDDFDRAFGDISKANMPQELAQWFEGFRMIESSLYKLLKKYNVTPITSIASFDHELHEAVVQVDSSEHSSGDIVQVLQKGFMIGNDVLRPAKVSVAR